MSAPDDAPDAPKATGSGALPETAPIPREQLRDFFGAERLEALERAADDH